VPDPNFHALRQVLEADVASPPFSAIVARRRRRTQRRTIAGVVLATVAVLAAGLALRPAHPAKPEPLVPPVPKVRLSPTPSPSASGVAAPPRPGVIALAAAPSGALYAIAGICTAPCTGPRHYAVVRSADLGGHWTVVGQLDGIDLAAGSPHLLVADDAHLWVLTDFTLLATADAGKHWQSTNLSTAAGNSGPLGDAVVAHRTAWALSNNVVMRATAGNLPAATRGQTSLQGLFQLTALDADRAVVLSPDADTGKGTWFETANRGDHWSKLFPDPCAGTIAEGSPYSRMAVGPDGTRWVVCATQPGTGQQRKELVVSTDDGQTWHRQGTLESSGYGTEVHPMSPTVAWRTGGRADIYRTTDRTHWTDVAGDGGSGGMTFVAIDANTALYFRSDTGTQSVEYLTRDGGRTWTNHPFTPPPG
jgi:photosystem II stability/assembly factor-like uncharacterized protein